MSKGKHAKPNSYVKPKFKKSLLLVLLSLVILCIIFDILTPMTDTQSIASTNQEVNNSSVTEASITPEPEIPKEIEPVEDENLKALINYEMSKYNILGNNLSFFYYNTENKKYYFYNDDTYFTAASTIKVPIAMYYYDEINSGNLTLDTPILYAKGCYEAGGGTTASLYSVGDNVPLSHLLEQSIINSDNTAVNILIKNLGYSNARKGITKYSDETVPEDFYTNNITSAGFSYDVINYLYEHQDNYQKLIEDMKKSSMGAYLKKYINDYDVAHKYGSYSGYVHDYGIVYGKETYLVGIFTKNVSGADEVIAQISLDILNYTLGNLDINTLMPKDNVNTNTTENSTSNETSINNETNTN